MPGLIDPEKLTGQAADQTMPPAAGTGAMTPSASMPGATLDGSLETMVPKVPSGMPNAGGTTATSTAASPTVSYEHDERPDPGVSGRLGGLLSSDSPYLARARTRALQFANRRGLMNSSIAAGAAEAAAIDAALPIASYDAGLADKARDRRLSERLQEREHQVQQIMQTERLDRAEAEAALDREQQKTIATLGAQTAIDENYARMVTVIQSNTDIPAETREEVLALLNAIREGTVTSIASIVNREIRWE